MLKPVAKGARLISQADDVLQNARKLARLAVACEIGHPPELRDAKAMSARQRRLSRARKDRVCSRPAALDRAANSYFPNIRLRAFSRWVRMARPAAAASRLFSAVRIASCSV